MTSLYINSLVYLGLFILILNSVRADEGFQFELTPAASFYTGDTLRTSTLGSGTATFRLTRVYWLLGDFTAGQASLDRNNGLGLKSEESFKSFDLAFGWNLPALLAQSLDTDLYASLGIGKFWLGKRSEIFGLIGGGLDMPVYGQHLFVRFDLKNYFYVLKNSRGSDFNSDMSLALGPSWLF